MTLKKTLEIVLTQLCNLCSLGKISKGCRTFFLKNLANNKKIRLSRYMILNYVVTIKKLKII